ncbi:hypothetical protein SALBM311S_04848 [Streptomyces alboniger]
MLLVVAAVLALVLQARRDSTSEARNRSVAVAQAFANAPGTVEALRSSEPTAILQPRAEAARRATGVDFIVVMNTDGSVTPIPSRTASARSSSAPLRRRWPDRPSPRRSTAPSDRSYRPWCP